MNVLFLTTPSRDSGTVTLPASVPLADSAGNAAMNGNQFQLATKAGPGIASGGSSIEAAVAAGTVPPAGAGSDRYGGQEAPAQNLRGAVAFVPDNADSLISVDRTPYNRIARYQYTSQVVPDVGNQLNPPLDGSHGEIAQGVGSPPGYQDPWRGTRNTFRLDPQPADTFLPLIGTPPGSVPQG